MSNKWIEPEFVGEATEGRVQLGLRLPDYAGDVVVNYGRLQLARKLAGLGMVTITDESVKEKLYDNKKDDGVSITGINADGTATAGLQKPKKAIASHSELGEKAQGLLGLVYGDYVGEKGTIYVDLDTISNKISSLRGKSVRSAAAWSHELNNELSSGFIYLSDHNHVLDNAARRTFMSTIYAAPAFISMSQHDPVQSAEGFAFSFGTSYLLGFLEKHMSGARGSASERVLQPSFLHTLRLERLVATRAVADFLRFFKPKLM